jgi:shikimate dehydrogenase
MRLYLLGRGIQHSLSPGTWNRVFRALGLAGWRYGLLDVDSDGLPAALAGLADPEVLGYNVTMPYKAWAFERSQVHSDDTRRARVGNWLHLRDGRLALANTDAEGARALLDAIPRSDRVLLLGAGGTAAALLCALRGRADRVVLANRTDARAVELGRRAASWPAAPAVGVVGWQDRQRAAAEAALLINTTSLGMRDERSPLDDRLRPRADARIYDVVYRAGPTPLQRQAARWGLPLADGLAHLEAQAVALLPHLGLGAEHAGLVRASLEAAAGRAPHRWRVPPPDAG